MSNLPPEEMRARIIPTTAEIQSLRAALTKCEAERQQAIDDLDAISADLTAMSERWAQAMDALREIAREDAEPYGRRRQEMGRIARAALLSLGEQP